MHAADGSHRLPIIGEDAGPRETGGRNNSVTSAPGGITVRGSRRSVEKRQRYRRRTARLAQGVGLFKKTRLAQENVMMGFMTSEVIALAISD
jgi:hypothetical protein